MGRTFKGLGSLSEGVECLRRASELLRGLQDGLGTAFMLNELGSVYRDLGNPRTALQYYDEALQLRRGAADRWGQAQILNNIGLVHARTGFQDRARQAYTEALAFCRSLADRNMEAIVLNGLAGTFQELGDLSNALLYFQQVLQLSIENGNQNLEAYANNNIGLIYDTWADSARGLSHYEIALSLFRGLKDQAGEALVLDNIGLLYAGVGDTQRALDFSARALYIRDRLNEPRGKAVTLINLGYASTLSGDQSNALKYFELAMPFTQDAQDSKLRAYALLSTGMAYTAIGQPHRALEYLVQALDIQRQLGDPRAQAITLDKMGEAYLALDEAGKALSCHFQAFPYWRALGDQQGLALSLYQTALADLRANNLAESRDKIEQAISIIEPLRGRMTSRQLRLTYFASKYDFYALDIEVHMRLYERNGSQADLEAALYATEKARARALLDQLSGTPSGSPRSDDPVLISSLRQVEAEINSRAESLMRLRTLGRIEDAVAVEKRLETLNYEYDHLEAQINEKSKSYALLTKPYILTVSDIQNQLLEDNTLLLEYVLGEKRSFLWAITKSSLEAFVLPSRSEVERSANDLRGLLMTFGPPRSGESGAQYRTRLRERPRYWQKATELSRTLLGPVSPLLENKRIVVVADGALRFISFASLTEPQPMMQNRAAGAPDVAGLKAEPLPLILRHEIVYLPSCSVLSLLRGHRRNPSRSVAVFADPVFDVDDSRVSAKRKEGSLSSWQSSDLTRALRDVGPENGGFVLRRLTFSLQEARAILALAPPLGCMRAVGFDANKLAAMSGELGQYKIVHFATHGILDDRHPELSGIVLSLLNERGEPRDGFLRLNDIYNLTLPVDLVVLSACQTGMGKEVKGEGLIGLARGFMNAGAARVVASLWKVDDEATAELMERFYRYMLVDGMSACSALRAAQIDMMKADRRWRAPYYWAAFVLQGDWK